VSPVHRRSFLQETSSDQERRLRSQELEGAEGSGKEESVVQLLIGHGRSSGATPESSQFPSPQSSAKATLTQNRLFKGNAMRAFFDPILIQYTVHEYVTRTMHNILQG
jgi:hypothetical protein